MSHDWLLVETLGGEPVVVADGRQTKNLIPIRVFLRRSPDLMAIQTAISETVRAGEPMSTITPRNDRVIRTEPVVMSDGRLHGVHVWIGPLNMEPPQRFTPGPLKWDLTAGVATDTPESIYESGRDPSTEATHGRTFAEDLPMRALNASETKVLSMAIKAEPGMTMCSTWTVTDHQGETISVGFVARASPEAQDDGSERLICRAMNWRADPGILQRSHQLRVAVADERRRMDAGSYDHQPNRARAGHVRRVDGPALPTEAELAVVDFSDEDGEEAPEEKKPRKVKKHKKDKTKKAKGD